MAGRERDWMDYAQLASSAAQNAQLSSLGDQLAALKKAESQKQLADFEVTVIRQILFRIEDRIRFFTKQASYSPQGKLLALRKLAEALESFNDPSFYRNYEDKDRHSALAAKVDEAAMQIARALPPADLAEFNEAVAWQKKLPLLAQAMRLSRNTETYLKQMEERPRLEEEHLKKEAEWQAAMDAMNSQLAPLEKELEQVKSQQTRPPHGPVLLAWIFATGLLLLPIVGIPLFVVLVVMQVKASRATKVQQTLRTRAKAVKAKIAAITPPKPKKLPEPPTKPSHEAAEQFTCEEQLGSSFPELEATFNEKRALVERVLEADAGLEKDLSELEARTLLHHTAQEVAAKMGLPLPPMTLPKLPKASLGVSVEVRRLAKQPGQKSAAAKLHIEQTGVGVDEAVTAINALKD